MDRVSSSHHTVYLEEEFNYYYQMKKGSAELLRKRFQPHLAEKRPKSAGKVSSLWQKAFFLNRADFFFVAKNRAYPAP